MNASDANSSVPVAESRPGRAPTEFAGTIDESVLRDLDNLVPRSAKLGISIMRFLGIGLLILGLPMAFLAHRDPDLLLYPSVALFAMGVCFLGGSWIHQKGRARFGLDQVITGRVYGAGIVIDQLGGRTDWEVFWNVHLSSSAALLFVRAKQIYGLPLHRSFFESEEAWQEVSQLIRERVRNTSLVADV